MPSPQSGKKQPKPLPLRRSTHIYCEKCGVSAENYGQKDCTWCGAKKVNWTTLSDIRHLKD